MADGGITPAQAAREVLRRRHARESLVAFAQAIEIPGAPLSDDADSWLFKPLGSELAAHHKLALEAIQQCIETDSGRLMIFAPPGSAKSTYASVVAPAWAMGRRSGFRSIMASFASQPAERQAKRCRQIVASDGYHNIWPEPTSLVKGTTAAHDWELTNGSGMIAAGMLGALTSNRADLIIIDDPVAGREEADSETMRRKIRQAYDDDLLTRLKPRGSIVLIQTRWHLDDLAGSILPEDYKGESGPVVCRDGQTWEVLCLPAQAERADDPLGRAIGAFLWPEWFDARHWANYTTNPRTWSALYQQRPQQDTGGQFEADWFHRYDKAPAVTWYGSSDFAVTEKTLDTHPDYTEHMPWGLDGDGDIWIDAQGGYSSQSPPDKTIDALLDICKTYSIRETLAERGVIQRALEPSIALRMRERKQYVLVNYLPSTGDKIAKVASFRARASAGTVHVQKGPKGDALIAHLCAFPFARYDDKADVCGNIGRFVDAMYHAKPAIEEKKPAVAFGTRQWLEHADTYAAEERARRERTLT